jgi:hypothetical protein
LFHANGNPADALASAADRLQGALAVWVHEQGAWPWVVAIDVMLVAGTATKWVGCRSGRIGRD